MWSPINWQESETSNWYSSLILKFYRLNFGCFFKGTSTYNSVALKIKNVPKTNTKILRFLKMDRRRIQRFFVKSKILQISSKIFKGKWKIFIDKNCLTDSNLKKSPSSKTLHLVLKIEVQSFKKKYIFLDFFRKFCSRCC